MLSGHSNGATRVVRCPQANLRTAATRKGRPKNQQIRVFAVCTAAFCFLKNKLRQIKQNVYNHETVVAFFENGLHHNTPLKRTQAHVWVYG